ncbi:MAG: class 1 isoprenoid biosynthesis enzyme [Polyangiales bacterium]
MNGARDLRDAFTRPATTPFVALVDACAGDLGLAGDPRVALLGRSTVLGYAYVRVQDDLVDEPDRVDRASVYAAEALLAEHLRLFARAAPGAEAFALRSDIMARFADVAAGEVDARGAAVDDHDLGWMGVKFLPMAVPLAAMAALAGSGAAGELVEFVREVGTALQLVNDVYNAPDDAAGGRVTPLLQWLAAEGVDPRDPQLRARLFASAALARTLDEARRAADAASRRARDAGLPRLVAVAAQARAMVDRCPERLCRLMLGAPV